MDLSTLSCTPTDKDGSSSRIANRAAFLSTAKHLARMIDTPDAVLHWHRVMDFLERPFPCFKGAYATAFAKSSGGPAALTTMSQATRLTLKLALHEDVKAIVHSTSEEARTPKVLDGVALPTQPVECLQSLDGLVLQAEAQVAALQARIARLNQARFCVERMARNTVEAQTMPMAAFTTIPPPTAKEAERAAKRAKRA